jgi:two-component system response regulator
MGDRFQRMRLPALPTVLFGDAGEDYRSMARDALLEGRNATDLRLATDGPDVVAYLARSGRWENAVAPRPALIVLDADLPGQPGGLDLIRVIKDDPAFKRIPVVALGENDDAATVDRAYDAGANTYFVKPVTFLALVKLVKVCTEYWLETAELPPGDTA